MNHGSPNYITTSTSVAVEATMEKERLVLAFSEGYLTIVEEIKSVTINRARIITYNIHDTLDI